MFFTLAIFTIFKAKDYYAIGIYPIYIAFGAVFLGEILKEGRKRYLQAVFMAIPLLLFIPIYEVAFPNNSPEYIIAHSEKYKKVDMLRWEDGKEHALPQDFADMLGWRELAKKTDSVYEKMPNKNKTLVLCDNYGQAGAINFYSRHGIKAVSFNADYLNWFDLTINYENIIRIKERGDAQEELSETSPLFQNSYLSDSVTNKFAREFGTVIFAFTGAKTDIRERLRNEIKENGGN
jgi:energy-coupling factor transporter transmembrane protein EcfT